MLAGRAQDGPRMYRRAGVSRLAILFCPGCGRGGLRVPDGRRGKVTCPTCGAEWFYPETIELSDVEFRCSKSGARFNVISSRRSPLHKFVIQKITNAADGARRPAEAEPFSSSQRPGAAPAPLSPKVGGWLARIMGRKPEGASSTKAAIALNDQPTVTTDAAATHDANEYNWTGFSCPYCSASSFVSGACGHLTCNGTNELRNGHYFHQCFCGHAGFISGTIKSFKGTWLSAEREVDSTKGPNPGRPQQSGKSVDLTILPSTHASPAKR
jgi:hypothetical protein